MWASSSASAAASAAAIWCPRSTCRAGLALSADEATLYVAFGTHLERIALGTGERTVLAEAPAVDPYETVAVDVCGAVYAVGYRSGDVVRVDEGGVTPLVNLGNPNYHHTSLRWGIGAAGLPRAHLFVGSWLSGITEIEVHREGVPPVF